MVMFCLHLMKICHLKFEYHIKPIKKKLNIEIETQGNIF